MFFMSALQMMSVHDCIKTFVMQELAGPFQGNITAII